MQIQLERVNKDPEQFTISHYDDSRMSMDRMEGPFTELELHAKFPHAEAELQRAIVAARKD